MKNVFLVFGYGIPRNILKDENYNFYLKMVFNRVYNIVLKNKINNPLIICSGEKTDMVRPYKRTEAEEMVRLFKHINKKPFLKDITRNWLFVPEKKSLSTLENFLNCKQLIEKRKIKKANFYIFCEQTREKRIKILAKKILNKNYNFKVIPIDFDISTNRYLSPKFLAKKEGAELKHSLWVLQSPENLKKHHKVFADKIKYFRKAGPNVHVDTIKEWWEQKLKELKN
ncbi:MAG: hypothetical protein HQ536_01640 [Parcubacteria group bacterium]|nr:hypothetical protein [Parcubacteria group bacterium]